MYVGGEVGEELFGAEGFAAGREAGEEDELGGWLGS